MAKRRTISKKAQRQIARERMNILFNEAKKRFSTDRELARRYVTLGRKIGMRYNVSLTKKDKLEICKKCNSFLVPGVNRRVRAHERRIVLTCLECGHIRRIPLKGERKGKLNKEPVKSL